MAEAAAHLTDHVFPRLSVRQWVLSVPKRLRYYLQRDKGALNAALRIFLRVVQQSLQTHCPGAVQCDPASLHLGAVALRPPLWLQPEHACALSCLRGRWGVCGADLVYRCGKGHSEPLQSDKYSGELVLTPLELINRIAQRVPPPRTHRHRYYGVLAPNSPLRATVTAMARVPVPAPSSAAVPMPAPDYPDDQRTAW